MAYQGTKRKVFISHYKGDRKEVDEFIRKLLLLSHNVQQ